MVIDDLVFDERGLIPVIVQDDENGQVLMFAYADREAVEKTLESGKTHFWSRSRGEQWQKGEESGNTQEVAGLYYDCDADCLLAVVKQTGVACHTGKRTCFFRGITDTSAMAPAFGQKSSGRSLEEVYAVIDARKRNPQEGSYVSGLFAGGIDRILKKVGEEAGETIIAAKNSDKDEIIYEATDLFFHTLVALASFDITPADITRELGRRFGQPSEKYRKSD